MTEPNDQWTLGETKDWLRDRVDDGEHCPCCGQMAKVYRRKMTAFTARAMIAMHRFHHDEYVQMPALIRQHLPDLTQGGYATLGAYWGLIEEEQIRREDGGRAGWWRLTDLGHDFVLGKITVPKYARIYDSRLLGFVPDDRIHITEVLGTNFDYSELMSGE
jgi:hypothetical protein